MVVEPSSKLLNRIQDDLAHSRSISVCAGFQMGKWRLEPLSRHLLSWLPFVALGPDEEPPHVGDWEPWVRAAAFRLFDKATDPSLRGEIGELLLHIICRQQFGTYPTLCKLFYKSATNAVVHGFDLVHTKYDASSDALELWLGEAKFYRDGKQAVREAITSITAHLDEGFLEQEKMLIGRLIDAKTPGIHKLKALFDDATSLDEIVGHMVVPTLICYDSPSVITYCGSHDDYIRQIAAETAILSTGFQRMSGADVAFVFIYLPLGGKKELAKDFFRRVSAHL